MENHPGSQCSRKLSDNWISQSCFHGLDHLLINEVIGIVTPNEVQVIVLRQEHDVLLVLQQRQECFDVLRIRQPVLTSVVQADRHLHLRNWIQRRCCLKGNEKVDVNNVTTCVWRNTLKLKARSYRKMCGTTQTLYSIASIAA